MALKLDHLPPAVASQLRSYYRRRRLFQLLRLLASVAIGYVVLVLLGAHLDRFLFLDLGTRVRIFWLVHGLVGAAGLAALVAFLLRRPTVRELAYELEAKLPPDAQEMYVTLHDVLSRGAAQASPVARQLVGQLSRSTAAYSKGFRAAKLVRDKQLRIVSCVLLLLLLFCGGLAVPTSYEFPLMLERFYFPGRNLPKPSFIKIKVSPARIVVGKGGEALIQAEVSGQIPDVLKWLVEALGGSQKRCTISRVRGRTGHLSFGRGERSEMSRIHRNLFLFSKGDLQESFSFRIRSGDAETEVRVVEVIAQPRVVDLSLLVTPPAYAGLKPEKVTDVRRPLRFLPGSLIKLSFRTDQPCPTRKLAFEGAKDPVEPDWDETAQVATHEFVLKQKTAFEITVVNKYGFQNVEPVKVSIGLRDDLPPTVRLEFPTSDLEKVPGELVPVQAQLKDDLGITEAAIRFVLNPDPDQETVPKEIAIPLPTARPKAASLSTALDLGKTGAIPGDTISLSIRARDTAGSDGLSREILVRVVPFTRGENERLRILALRFVSEALHEVSEATRPEAAQDGMAIPKEAWEKIAALARKLQLPLAEEPTIQSLLDLLDREHHLTDSARHKEDVRLLSSAIRFACCPFAREERKPEELARFRKKELELIGRSIVPQLVKYRQLKNLIWRLFGMRYEAVNIREELGKLGAGGTADQGRTESMKRRIDLYLKTLQDIGDELIELSRTTPALDAEQIKQIVGEQNAAAYYMGHGALKRRRASCDEAIKQLSATLAAAKRGLLPLHDEEVKARIALAGMYQAHIENLLAPPATAQYGLDAAAWLAAEGRLLEREPFARYRDRLVNLVLSGCLAEAGSGPGLARTDLEKQWKKAAAILAPDQRPAAAAVESDALDSLSQEWELASALRARGVSHTERLLEVALLQVEAARRRGDSAQLVRLTDLVQKLDLGAELADASVVENEAMSRHTPTGDLAAALRELSDEAARHSDSRSPAAEMERLLGRLRETGHKLDESVKALKSGAGESGHMADLVPRLEGDAQAMRQLLAGLSIRLGLLSFDGEEARQAESLLLKLREAFSRYDARSRAFLTGLRTAGPAAKSTAELTKLEADVDHLRTLHQSLIQTIEKTVKAQPAGQTREEETKRPIIEQLAQTQRYVDAMRSLLASRDRAATAREYLKEFKEASTFYLSSNAHLLGAARQALADAEAALKGNPVQAAVFTDKVNQSCRFLEQMKRVAQTAGQGELSDRVGTSVTRLLEKAEALPFAHMNPDAVEVNRRLFAIGEMSKSLSALENDCREAAEPTQDEPIEFRGGPEGIWGKEYRYQAEQSRLRLIGQARFARLAVMEAVFEALNEKPERQRLERGLAWSVFLYRLVRSELAGISGARPPATGEERTVDPHLKFLREELEKARKVKNLKNYEAATKEYLDSMADFLRY